VITFERESRTPHSEAYVIWEEGSIVGRIDLHFRAESVSGTLCTTADANEARIQELIEAIDERLIMTAQPYRDDLTISVWRGSPAGTFSDASAMEDEGG
jgi:hypothetical protein